MIEIRKMRVLIVDDMVNMARSIHNLMKVIRYGKEFQYASNGREALEILKKKPVDLILLDYNMPVMTGAEVLNIIREDRALRDVPVIMITAEAYRDYVAEVGESEIDAYILKPITVRLLEEKVSYVIQKANNPPPMVVHLKNARKCEEQGDMDGAIREARLAMEANPKATRPIRELGYYYFKKGDLKTAEVWLLKAAKLNPLDVFAFHHLGEIYLSLNNIEQASACFEKAMDISPRHLDRGVAFAKTLVQRNLTKKAIQVFQKSLDLAGSTPQLAEEIADFCYDAGVKEYAAKLWEEIVRTRPSRTDLVFKLGKALMDAGNLKRAALFLSRAAEVEKENVEIQLHLAKCYMAIGNFMLAQKPLFEALKTSPDNVLAKELLDQCEAA